MGAANDTLNITLDPGREAQLHLFDAAGDPVKDATVTVDAKGALPWRGELSVWTVSQVAHGVYAVRDLPKGAVDYVVTTADGVRHAVRGEAGGAIVRHTLR